MAIRPRTLRRIALIAVVVTVVAIIVYAQRHQVAKRIANAVIRDLGYEATHISVGELSHDRIRLDELIIVSGSGDRYAFEGVTLPSIAGKGGSYSADRLLITQSGDDKPATPFGEVIDTILNLPETLVDTEIRIGELQPTDELIFLNAAWSAVGSAQQLSFVFGALDISVDARTSESGTRLTVSAERSASVALTAELSLDRVDGNYRAQGPVTADATPWLQFLQSLDVLPQGTDIVDAILNGSLLIQFDDGGPGTILAIAQLELTDEASLAIESTTQIAVETPLSPVLTYRYPDNEWLARIEMASLSVGVGDDSQLPVVLENVDCLLGVRCRSRINVVDDDLRFGELAAESVNLRFDGAVDFVDEIRLTVANDANAHFEGFQSPAFTAESLTLMAMDSAEAIIVDDIWHWNVVELQIAVQSLAAAPGLLLSFPVTLSESGYDGEAKTLSSRFVIPPGVHGNWDGRPLALPGINGDIKFAEDYGTADLELADTTDALKGTVNWYGDRLNGNGSLAIDELVADFGRTPLSDYITDLAGDIDIVRGTWALHVDLAYDNVASKTVYEATASHSLVGLAGRIGDTVLAGVDGQFETRVDSDTGVATAAGNLAAQLLEVGIPVENLQMAFAADVRRKSAQFASVSAEALGGTLKAEPFTWHAAGEPDTAILHLDAIQLPLIVGLLDFEELEMEGSVSGTLPIRIAGMNMTIEDGMIESDAPGGVIRYGAASEPAEAPASGLAFVSEALRNFEFDSLTSTVGYGESGDLVLQMRLTGVSPDIDPLQPVILNLAVEDNVLQMLRSLRAVRSIQDILEQRTSQ